MVNRAILSPPDRARLIFRPIAPTYERWSRWLSLGQDSRWRQTMVNKLGLTTGSEVLDVAAGTGSITRLMESHGLDVISVDQSQEMVRIARQQGAVAVIATAERLPFRDNTFDGVTFGYLLRYVDDVSGCLGELVRVAQPGGMMGMVEFGRPAGVWSLPWWIYTRAVLPLVGSMIGSGWRRVGRFLGPSIDSFAHSYPPDLLADEWTSVGMVDVQYRSMSLGGGLVMWGRRG